MPDTYKALDGREMRLTTMKNIAVLKRIASKEIYADITSVVQGCLDSDLLTDGTDPIIAPNRFLGHEKHHSCPYCTETITEEEQLSNVTAYLESATISKDEDDPEFPFVCPVCGAKHHTEGAARYCCEEAIVYRCSYCNSIVEKGDLQPYTVPDGAQQWLVVSKWLGTSLSLLGEPVFHSAEDAYIWARIKAERIPAFDEKLAEVCMKVGILEGQEHFQEVK